MVCHRGEAPWSIAASWGGRCAAAGGVWLCGALASGEVAAPPTVRSSAPAALYDVAQALTGLKDSVLQAAEAERAKTALKDDALARTRAANAPETAAFAQVTTSAAWETFRDARLEALRRSLGSAAQPLAPAPLPAGVTASPGGCEVTGTYEGDGFRIANLAIAARPGLPITANLYQPATPGTNRPGILMVTSHHNPKTQGELQDLGIAWARRGCLMLVADNLGYGERRQQPYAGREDYRWRYYMGMQLYAVGETLLGWMVADQRRALDVLLAQPGVDPARIVVVGSVAGGGDLAGTLVALDRRPTGSIPYNFGSPGTWPVPGADGAVWTNYIAGGDWDAARCPPYSGRDGFTPWMLVAAAAPRYTVFAKEFTWRPEGDGGYARIAHVYDLYGAADRLAWTPGHGMPGCNNVSISRRKQFDPTLERWLKMPPPDERQGARLSGELTCMPAAVRARWQVRPVHAVLADLAAQQLAAARAALAALPADRRKDSLRAGWAQRLGVPAPAAAPAVTRREITEGKGFVAERLLFDTGWGVSVPAVLVRPRPAAEAPAARAPVVLCVAQEGKEAFRVRRALEVADLLARGVAVCQVDVRGTGETRPAEDDRYWYSVAADVAARDLMLGQPTLGSRVRELQSVVRYLQGREDLDGHRLAVWGDSFAPVNPPTLVDPPMKGEVSAWQAEPLGATAALLLALFEDDVQAVVARGGLTGFAALLDGPACHVALDAIVPQALARGDLADVVAVLAPRPVRVEAAVDGRNRLAGPERLARDFAPARDAYHATPDRLALSPVPQDDVAGWLAAALQP